MAKQEIIVMGVDPGTIVTGYGILQFKEGIIHTLDFGCIRPPKNLPLHERYLIIFESIQALVRKHRVSILSIETQFAGKNMQSAIKLGMARGVSVVAAMQCGASVVEFAPSKIKSASTGSGHASKKSVQRMMQLILTLEKIPEPEDAADALACAFCYIQSIRMSHV